LGVLLKKEEMKIPAFVLSSHVIGLAIIRSLGRMDVPVVVFYYDNLDMGYFSKFAKQRIHVTHPEKNEKEFVESLLTYGKRVHRSVLIPADDATLKAVSKNKEILSEYFIVTCPEWKIVEQYIDKKITYSLSEACGVQTPKSFDLQMPEDLEKYSKILGFPCLLKPRQSHIYYELFKNKMVKANNLDGLLAAFNKINSAGIDVLLQEYIPGAETLGVNYNSYYWNNEPLIEFTAQKCRLAAAEFGVPCVVKSTPIPDIIDPAHKILKTLGYYGYSCMEFKKDPRTDKFVFMEINGRQNRSSLLAMRCGVNFPFIEYQHLVHGKLPQTSSFKNNVYWIDSIPDIANSIRFLRKKRYSLKDFIRPYINGNIFAIFDLEDIKPFLKRVIDIMKLLYQKILFSILSKLYSKHN
jgi:predicted ATP-grasp superfamily ATP-dependent carboligase